MPILLLSLLSLLSLLPVSLSRPCPPGFYGPPSSCTPCPPGTYNPLRGVGVPQLCRPCPSLFFSSAGSSRCTPCPPGKVSRPRASVCRACGPGNGLSFSNRCFPCSEGFYSNLTAALSCTRCPAGTSPLGSTSPDDCFIPKFCRARIGSCGTCGAGKERNDQGECENCPFGSFSKGGPTKCTKCPKGSYGPRRSADRCFKCKEGFTSNGPGASLCKPVGATRCPSDTFENANGDCDRCSTGFFWDLRTNLCVKCEKGAVSLGGLVTKCQKCPEGQTPDSTDAMVCRCPTGLFVARNGKCRKCPPGTGNTFGNVADRSACIKCEYGEFQNKAGSVDCKPCPIGSIAPGEGFKRCLKCPRGSTSRPVDEPGVQGAKDCIFLTNGCKVGTVEGKNAFGGRKCMAVNCQVGTPEEDVGVKCLPCKPGFVLRDGKCKRCKEDEVSPGGMATKCTKCRAGFTRHFNDGSRCSCGGGNGRGLLNGECKVCPPGTYSNGEVCVTCAKGTFTSGSGQPMCRECPRGTVAETEGMARCTKCPKGTTPSWWRGAKECLPMKL